MPRPSMVCTSTNPSESIVNVVRLTNHCEDWCPQLAPVELEKIASFAVKTGLSRWFT